MTKIDLILGALSKVFGDFVSKVIGDGVDVLKSAIKDADLDRKSYNQNLQTKMYQMMIDALNGFTYNKYEKQAKLYNAAESILKGFISTKDNIDAVKSGLKIIISDVNNDTCQDFLEILYGEICKDDNSDLYKEIDMLWKRRESEYIHGEFAKIDQNNRETLEKLTDLKEVLDYIRRMMNSQENNQQKKYNKILAVNRADEYAEKWNNNVFLNNFNERDENAKDKVNIKLKDIYLEKLLPNYKWRNNKNYSCDLRDLLREYIVDKDEKKMLLILGHAGIGKSTLITWIMENIVESKDEIFVYQFANDLGSINWMGENILNDIFNVVGLEYDELENKTLIIDGFDEIYIGDERERILNKLDQELKRKNILKCFTLIITCRENYIYNLQNIDCNYIVLQAWDGVQIDIFCRTYWEKCGNEISKDTIRNILKNKEIFGIPLILYMILALDVDIEKGSSKMDIYNQVFSLKRGGIYDRCYDTEHRINSPEIKKHIHRISQRIAFWIFENNADKAYISQEKFKEICDNEMSELGEKVEEIQNDTLIGNFFRLKHCEGKGTDELQFVHRSIYEYFVVIYFFESLYKLKNKEEVAGKLGELLKDGKLSWQLLEFVKCKFDNMKELNLPDIITEVFNIMLRDGMTYHIGAPCKNAIERERNIFANMLLIVDLWNSSLGKLDRKIIIYLQCNKEADLKLRGIELGANNDDMERADLYGVYLNGADLYEADLIRADLRGAFLSVAVLNRAYLIGADLRGADLRGADLSEAYLSGADLRRTYLSKASLSRTDLVEADLRGADLRGADLRGADLRGADLSETILNEKQVNVLCEKYDLSKSMVFLSVEKKIISYQEYRIRKQIR